MKVLVISHNPMSKQFGIGKTLLSLFSVFQKSEICQIYINSALPDQDVCESFYRLTDKQVLRGVLTRKVSAGAVEARPDTDMVTRKTVTNPKNRRPDREIARDMIWKLSPWYNRMLKQWIYEQNPTSIFAAIGSGTFLYDMSVRIAKDYHIPLYTYICDDFYSMQPPKEFLGKLWKHRLIRNTKALMRKTCAIVTICDELTNYYATEFGKPAHTIMTGTNFKVAEHVYVRPEVRNICYFGKLSLNRYQSIANICRTIDAINAASYSNYTVDIYSDKPDETIRRAFAGIQSAVFHDFVSGNEFQTAFFSSDVLIHVEAFDASSIDRVKHSVSTKIADTLASGIPMLAYGPECVASIGHLVRNKCAFVATSEIELKQTLKILLNDTEVRKATAMRAIVTAERYHHPVKVSQKLYALLSQQ